MSYNSNFYGAPLGYGYAVGPFGVALVPAPSYAPRVVCFQSAPAYGQSPVAVVQRQVLVDRPCRCGHTSLDRPGNFCPDCGQVRYY